MFRNVADLVEQAVKQNKPIHALMIEQECEATGLPRERVIEKMDENLRVMEQAVERTTGCAIIGNTMLMPMSRMVP